MKNKLLRKVRKTHRIYYYPEKWVSGYGDWMPKGYYLLNESETLFLAYSKDRTEFYNDAIRLITSCYNRFGTRRNKIREKRVRF